MRIAEEPLEIAMAKAAEARATAGETPMPMRSIRRSDSAHYGFIRHALSYLLSAAGLTRAQTKHISLLLRLQVSHTPRARRQEHVCERPRDRKCFAAAETEITRCFAAAETEIKPSSPISPLSRLQMLRLAQHDLQFVREVSAAERTILHIATRTLAHKAHKLGSTTSDGSDAGALPHLSALELGNVRREATRLLETLSEVPGQLPGATPPPPPLVLAPADTHLLYPPLSMLVGESVLLSPEVVAAGGEGTLAELPTVAVLDGIEVLGLYFSASCVLATSVLATSVFASSSLAHVPRPHVESAAESSMEAF